MPNFNLDNYETVEDRLARFWQQHPDGRVHTELAPAPDGQWIIRAEVYRNGDDPHPWATGYAHEVVGATPVNRTSALENCETSAIGRALANAGYATKGQRASREEMDKAQRGAQPSSRQQSRPEPLASQAQVGLLQGLLKKLLDPGGAMAKDAYREAALDWIAQQLGGLKLASSKELTKAQASQLINSLQDDAA